MAFIDVLEQFRNYLKGILDSSNERENEAETIDNIRKGINFKGSNLKAFSAVLTLMCSHHRSCS